MISWRYLMKSVLSVATKRCYTEYAVKSTALKAVLSFVAAGYKREGSGDKKEMYKNTKNIRKRTYTWQKELRNLKR